MKPTAAALLLLLLALPVAGSAQQPYRIYGSDRYFAVDWEPAQWRGRPALFGHVTNLYGMTAIRLTLLVESLDAAGQVVDTARGYISELPPGPRYAFEVPLKRAGAAYRVTVLSWDWKSGMGL